MMMGFSVLFIFALIHFSTLYDGGNSEDLSNTDSNHHHHLHPRQTLIRRFKKIKDGSAKKKEDGSAEKIKDGSAEKEEDPSIFYIKHLEFVALKDASKGAAKFSLDEKDHYIIVNNCKDVTVKALKISETIPSGFLFLVNKDNFEILEWRKMADINRLPLLYISICESHVIVKDNNGIHSMTKDSITENTEVLTLNYDIKGQDFQTEDCGNEKIVKPDKIKVIKRVTVDNKNNNPVKHVVKFDQGIDRTSSFLNSSTHTVGGTIGIAVPGKILNLGMKYDYSHLNSETTSNLDKDLHSVSMEIEIPAKNSCTIEIKSRTSTVQSLCSGQLFRQYKNGQERTTFIRDFSYQEEKADLLISMNPCRPM